MRSKDGNDGQLLRGTRLPQNAVGVTKDAQCLPPKTGLRLSLLGIPQPKACMWADSPRLVYGVRMFAHATMASEELLREIDRLNAASAVPKE